MIDNKIMLWTPFEWKEFTSGSQKEEPQGTTIMDCGGHYICHQLNIRPIEQRQQLASAIVSAVNCTWGSGINPEAVSDIIESLKNIVKSEWWMEYMRHGELDLAARASIDKAKL